MDLGLDGRAALVAASSRGLGRAIATALAAVGAKVMISARDEATLAQATGEIHEATGTEVDYYPTDLTRVDDIRALVQRTAERFGGVDVLVSNAGGPPAGSFDTVSDEDWRGAFELNLMSVVRFGRDALPHMRKRGFGRIVNVASSSIKEPIEGLILSNTFRAGVAGLAKSLSFELAPDDILVNTLGPGRISTERSASIDVAQAERLDIPVEEVRGGVESQIPLGRYGGRRSSRGWPCFWLLRRAPEYRSAKRTELRFRALLTEDEKNVRFERVEVGQASDSKEEFLR